MSVDTAPILAGLVGTPSRPFDRAAWEARMDAKRADAQRRRELDAAAAAPPRRAPRAEPKRRAVPPPREGRGAAQREQAPATRRERKPVVRPCTGTCGRLTRPASVRGTDAPETVARVRDGKCRACLRGPSTSRPPRAPRPVAAPRPVVERPDPVRPCVSCGAPTRPAGWRADRAPGTRQRAARGICCTCYRPKSPRAQVALERIVELYVDANLGAREVGERLGISGQQVINRLRAAGVPVRARGQRVTRPTGSKPKEYDAAFVEQVRELASQDMTHGEIAAAAGTTRKVVQRVMERHGIPSRPAVAKRPIDGAAPLKARMAAAAVTAADVRAWAGEHGVPISTRGLPPARVLDQYLAANGAAR